MSLPAREVASPAPARAPSRPARAPARPAPSPARTPRRQTPAPRAPVQVRRPARRFHTGFLVVSGAVIAVLVVGIVTLTALLAQTAFHLQEVQGRLDGLDQRQVMLTDQVAHLSSPGAVAKWARQHDMVMPAAGDVHILPVAGTGG